MNENTNLIDEHNEELTPIQELSPFKRMVLSLGTLPSAFYNTMTYYESLVYFYEYLKNEVIPTVNNNGEAVEELQTKYIELKSYIDNYFDNLNVQEEINAKLDEMAEDGTLTNLIKDYVDPIYEDYENEINGIITNQNQEITNFKSSVNDSLNSMNSAIASLSSGSPAGVYATVTALTTADPDHSKIYVVKEDGKWYYYNTTSSSWTAGGTYQSTGVGDNEIDINNLVDNLKYNINTEIKNINSMSFTTNSYINWNNGSISSSNNFNISENIFLNVGDMIEFEGAGYQQAVAMLSMWNRPNRYTPLVRSIDNNSHVYTYKALVSNNYVICTHYLPTSIKIYRKNKNEIPKDYINNEFINNIILNKISDPSFTTDSYITAAGNIYTAENQVITNFIEIKNNAIIRIESYNDKLQISGNIAGLCLYDENQNYITGYTYPSDSNYLEFTTTNDTKYLRLTITEPMTSGYNIYYKEIINLLNRLENKINLITYNPSILSMYSNITCIGDSLTYSQVYTSDNTSRQAYETYPEILAKFTGTNTTALAHAGDSTSDCWNRYNESMISKTNQLAIIYLGTNEGLTDTVDTDCSGNDYTQYANNNTGCYGKIIKKYLDLNAKVILVKCYAAGSVLEQTNSTIEHLAQKFNIPYIENTKFNDEIYHTYPDLSGINSVHYNDLGYLMFTKQLINNVNNLSDSNKAKILPI